MTELLLALPPTVGVVVVPTSPTPVETRQSRPPSKGANARSLQSASRLGWLWREVDQADVGPAWPETDRRRPWQDGERQRVGRMEACRRRLAGSQVQPAHPAHRPSDHCIDIDGLDGRGALFAVTVDLVAHIGAFLAGCDQR